MISLLIAATLLTRLSDVRALSPAEFAEGRDVAITGCVTAVLKTQSCLIEDDTGRFMFQMEKGPKPPAGAVIAATGRTQLDRKNGIRQESVVFTSADVIGSRELPLPPLMTSSDIAAGAADFATVRIRAIVSAVFVDEIDPQWNYMVVKEPGCQLYVAVPNIDSGTPYRLSRLIDAEVELTGAGLPHYCAERMFVGPHLELWGEDCIKILRPAPEDPSDAPELEDIYHVTPMALSSMHRRRIEGVVLAAWDDSRMLLRDAGGRTIGVELSNGLRAPRAGESVVASGFPATDLFHLNLSSALWKPSGRSASAETHAPEDIRASDILFDEHGRLMLKPAYHGRLIRLSGTVQTSLRDGEMCGWIGIRSDGQTVPVYIPVSAASDDIRPGCRLRITGIALLAAENWNLGRPFPMIGNFRVVLRDSSDLEILSRPPWWTPARLSAVIAALLAFIAAGLVWIRVLNRAVARRGHLLAREELAHRSAELRFEERTRLAVELHDSLSQNLSGLACQITAVRKSLPDLDRSTAKRLDIAERMLSSSRTELKRCLWDLRGTALTNADLEDAIRSTVATSVGDAALEIRFDAQRSRLTDAFTHALLCIVRELSSNSVRHGHASTVRIEGASDGNMLRFSVSDDGCGFDTSRRAGVSEGHFGLEGIKDRVARLGGTFALASSPGGGTRAYLSLPLPEKNDGQAK